MKKLNHRRVETMQQEKRTITAETASMLYDLSKGTLANLRSQKKGPTFYRVGRKVLYRVEDFENWLQTCPVLTKDSINLK